MSKFTDITHPNFRCTLGACPAVYTDRTPESSRCVGGTCPAVLDDDSGNFIFIGERLDPVPEELAGKVGETEAAVSLPAELVLASLGVNDLVEAANSFVGEIEDTKSGPWSSGNLHAAFRTLREAVNRIKGGA